jgi:anti-sigma B factor antagonist
MPDEYELKPFHCEEDTRGGEVRLRPHGDLDMSTAPVLEEHIQRARASGARTVVVDLSTLEFMDSTGLTLITRYDSEARRDGFDFALIPGNQRIQRLFDLTGLAGYFTFLPG